MRSIYRVLSLSAALSAIASPAWSSQAAAPTRDFNVTIRPTLDLVYTWFLYAAAPKGDSRWRFASFTRLDDGDFRAGQLNSFVVAAAVGDEQTTYDDPNLFDQTCAILGIYSDACSRITVSFDNAIAGPMIAADREFYQVFPGRSESAMAQHLRTGDRTALFQDYRDRTYLLPGASGTLVNFCYATNGGTVIVDTLIPEASTVLTLSVGSAAFLFRRR